MFKNLKVDEDKLREHIISRQNGSVKEGLREIYQNAQDSGANLIKIQIHSDSISVYDDGAGMDSSTIDDFFSVLGASNKKTEDVGEFGIGISQIINFGICVWLTRQYAVVIDLKRRGPKYAVFKRDQYVDGTRFICSFYQKWRPYKIEKYLKKNILPTCDVVINNLDFHPRKEMLHETRYYEAFKGRSESSIYLLGIRIQTFESNFTFSVNVKDPERCPQVNFARNELMESDPRTEMLMDYIAERENSLTASKTYFTIDECKTIMNKVIDGATSLTDVMHKKIIPTAGDDFITPAELPAEVLIGQMGIQADDCIKQGHTVVLDKVRGQFEEFARITGVTDISDKSISDISRRGYVKNASPEGVEKLFSIAKNINRLFESERRIHIGESDIYEAWTDGKYRIWLDKPTLQSLAGSENAKTMWIYRTLCHEYAHSKDTRRGDTHGMWFADRFQKNIDSTWDEIITFL